VSDNAPFRIGTSHEATVWLNLDPCGIICCLVTWGLITYSCTVTVGFTLIPWRCTSVWKVLNSVVFVAIGAMALAAHVQTVLTDPGAVPRDAVPLGTSSAALEEGDELEAGNNSTDHPPPYKKWCRKCEAFKPSRAHHCSVCARCNVYLDHHCPW
jgi:hypothetical protein